MNTLERILEDFLRAKEAASRSDLTLRNYRHTLGEFARFVGWPILPQRVEEFFVSKRETCNSVTIRSMYHAVRAFVNWIYHQELLDRNPLDKIDKPKNVRYLPKAAPVETMRKLFYTLRWAADENQDMARRDYALFRLAYDTGIRATELCMLRVDDLDLERGSVVIRRGKGDADRLCYFGEKCQAILQRWVTEHPGSEWLFPSREHKPGHLTRQGVYQALQRWSNDAGVKLTVHQIRHSYATHSLRQLISLGDISAQMGHCDISVTAIYLKLEDEPRRLAHREKSPGKLLRGL